MLNCSSADRSGGFLLVDETTDDGSSLDVLARVIDGCGGYQVIGIIRKDTTGSDRCVQE